MCREFPTVTCNGRDRISGGSPMAAMQKHIVGTRKFVLNLPESSIASRAAPALYCQYYRLLPLRTWNVGPGSRVGVIGIGGLGHLAVRLAEALGATVTVITGVRQKLRAHELGAKHVYCRPRQEDMQQAGSSFDVIIVHDSHPARSLCVRAVAG